MDTIHGQCWIHSLQSLSFVIIVVIHHHCCHHYHCCHSSSLRICRLTKFASCAVQCPTIVFPPHCEGIRCKVSGSVSHNLPSSSLSPLHNAYIKQLKFQRKQPGEKLRKFYLPECHYSFFDSLNTPKSCPDWFSRNAALIPLNAKNLKHDQMMHSIYNLTVYWTP